MERDLTRTGFYLNLPAGGVSVLILYFIALPEHTKKDSLSFELIRKIVPELDLIGFLLFVPPSLMFLLALQFGSDNAYTWNSATIIGLFVGAAIMIVIFIMWERRVDDRAMIPGSLLNQRVVWASCVYAMCNISCTMVVSKSRCTKCL